MKKILVVKIKDGEVHVNPLHVSHITMMSEGQQSFIWLGDNHIPVTRAECEKFLEEFNAVMQ